MLDGFIVKLKEVVQNNTLKKMGELFIQGTPVRDSQTTTVVRYVASEAVDIRCSKGFFNLSYVAGASTGQTSRTSIGEYLYCALSGVNLFIGDQVKLTQLQINIETPDFDISELRYSPNLTDLNIFRVKPFTVYDLMNYCPSIIKFSHMNRNCMSGNISDFRNTMEVLNIRDNSVNGNLDTFLDFGNLRSLDVRDCPNIIKKRSTIDTLTDRLGASQFLYNGTIIEDE